MRWAALVSSMGYRVVVNLGYAGCDEVIEVFLDPIPSPAFIIQQTESGVVLVDRLGMTLRFAKLTDVLLAMVPLGKVARREVLRASRPPWLPVISSRTHTLLGGAWRCARRIAGRSRRGGEAGRPQDYARHRTK